MAKFKVVEIKAHSKEEAMEEIGKIIFGAEEKNESFETEELIKRGFDLIDRLCKQIAENGVVLDTVLGVEDESIAQFIVDRTNYWKDKYDAYSLDDIEKMLDANIEEAERYKKFLECENARKRKLKERKRGKKCSTSTEKK